MRMDVLRDMRKRVDRENMSALERSEQQVRDGAVVTKTLKELETMEHE